MSVSTQPRVSVVCNTLDRADALERMLQSLELLTYPQMEVVVVAGPCRDHTDEVLERWADRIKVRRCPAPNLSMSRNIGIAAAAGDIVAFIDDDGVAEPSWLDELIDLYSSDEVAGAGGVAFDHTGYTYQCRFNSVDRLGNARWDHLLPVEGWSAPGSWEVPYIIGTNATFRRDRLIEIGGFDEEYEYYLDESDVCIRLVDAGYVIRQSPHAPVHHKFLSSRIRDPQRITLNLFPIVKNKIYFSMVNGRGHASTTDLFADNAQFAVNQRSNIRRHHEHGEITLDQLRAAEASIDRGWEVGLAAGRRGRVALLDGLEDGTPEHAFLRFPNRSERPGRRLCLLTQTLPSGQVGGISRYMWDAARALSRRGHEVRLITQGGSHSTVDLEEGVWVHRIAPRSATTEPVLADAPPERVWNQADVIADEVVRLSQHRPIDAVYAAVWDTEAIATLERSATPVVTALVTTLAITLELRPEWQRDNAFLHGYVEPLIAAERSLVERSHLVHALSHAVATEVERTSRLLLDPARLVVAPLGVEDRIDPTEEPPTRHGCEVLFVGRFEKRKGVDLVLGSLPALLQERPDVRVVMIGRDDLDGEDGVPYRQAFEEAHMGAPWLDRIDFRGEVDDAELWDAYRSCDIFVAPSRFESFGLIFVEAMMCSRPVVALKSGAANEVIEDGSTGLLVSDDADDLRLTLLELIDDPERRRAMGDAGRARYEQWFTADAMGARLEKLLQSVRRVPAADLLAGRQFRPHRLPDGTDGIALDREQLVLQLPSDDVCFLALWIPAEAFENTTVRLGDQERHLAPPVADAFVHLLLHPAGGQQRATIRGPKGAAVAGAIVVDTLGQQA